MLIHFDPADIGCGHIRQFLYEYVERELDARLLMAMDNHILSCSECRELADSYRLSVEAARRHLQQAGEARKIPAEFKQELVRTLTGN